jgi:hypothetical protein
MRPFSVCLRLALLSAFLMMPACATRDFIKTSRIAIDTAARAQTEVWREFARGDLIHQEAIVAEDLPKADRRIKMDAYRAVRARLLDAMDALAKATDAAASSVDAFEAGDAAGRGRASALGHRLGGRRGARRPRGRRRHARHPRQDRGAPGAMGASLGGP